jgi:hypothetical protein
MTDPQRLSRWHWTAPSCGRAGPRHRCMHHARGGLLRLRDLAPTTVAIDGNLLEIATTINCGLLIVPSMVASKLRLPPPSGAGCGARGRWRLITRPLVPAVTSGGHRPCRRDAGLAARACRTEANCLSSSSPPWPRRCSPSPRRLRINGDRERGNDSIWCQKH